jgi:hypothetical protein
MVTEAPDAFLLLAKPQERQRSTHGGANLQSGYAVHLALDGRGDDRVDIGM